VKLTFIESVADPLEDPRYTMRIRGRDEVLLYC
jgi:hypothetical protein